jgi:hypothetical protein
MAQNCSNGPAAQVPSLTEALSGGVLGEHVPSLHSFGCVVFPGRPHDPPGHCERTVHGAPALLPPWQRLPPQVVAPTPTQSALDEQAVAARLSQVSQKHLRDVNPGAVQGGLALVIVRVCMPVLRFIVIERFPTLPPGSGGQS